MLNRSLPLLAPFALGLAITACDQAPSTPPSAPAETESHNNDQAKIRSFEQQALAIKAAYKDPKTIEAELLGLNSRMGHFLPDATEPKPSVPQWIGEPKALGKTSATTTLIHVKLTHLTFQYANTLVVTVGNGQTLSASASKQEAGLDPMLVGFYKTESTSNANAYRTKIVGLNDDKSSTNLDSHFSWKNTTGSAKTVRVVAFAYPGTYGKSGLFISLSNGGAPVFTQSKNLVITARPDFNNHEAPQPSWGCTGPHQSRIRMIKDASVNLASTFIGVNASTMRGAYVTEVNYEVNLNDILTPGYPNFFLPYIEGNSKPQPVPLLGADFWSYYGGFNTFLGGQVDRFSCTNPDL